MDEKQSTFTVTDRRKFTLDGELREGAPTTEREEVAAEPPAAAAAPASEKVVTMPSPEKRETALAEESEEVDLPQFTAQESAEQDAAYQESSRQIDDMLRQSNPEMGATGAISFEHIIQSFYVSAMLAMGAGTEPGQKARVDILGARQSIDMLALLQEKTKGNLTQKEEATLQNVLFELRMMFLEITNAIAQSAQRPIDGKKK
ncbi:MAG TPA: DUF1844 domain-containing protein [Acidobacteriaceae bacterium]|jgi:hypothetical protein|nr:DUF1844 domain-containing protein [Acidobacteriaceae bacterium]